MPTTARARFPHILRAMVAQVLLVALLVTHAAAQLVTTIAGGARGHVDGVGTNSQFTYLTGVIVDPSTGTLFIADESFLRAMNLASGLVTTFAGGGPVGVWPIDGAGTNARFSGLSGVTVNGDTVFVSDYYNCVAIRTVTPSAVVSTFAGQEMSTCGYADGIGTNVGFGDLSFAVDSLSANLYVADWGSHTIRFVSSSGLVSTIAGDPLNAGWADGTGTNALFDNPAALTVDSLGTVYICDSANHAIRAMKGDSVSTFVGTAHSGSQDGVGSNACFNNPNGITVDVSNILYVADTGNFKIRRITPDGVVTTFVGGGANGVTPGYADGLGTNAYFSSLDSITIDTSGSTLYVTDNGEDGNPTIRSVNLVPTPSLTSSPSLSPTSSPLSSPSPVLTGSPSAAAAAAPPQTSTVATNIATSFGCAIGGGLVVLLAQEGLRRYRAGRIVVSARKVKEQQLPKYAASGFSGAHSAPLLLGVSDGSETSLN